MYLYFKSTEPCSDASGPRQRRRSCKSWRDDRCHCDAIRRYEKNNGDNYQSVEHFLFRNHTSETRCLQIVGAMRHCNAHGNSLMCQRIIMPFDGINIARIGLRNRFLVAIPLQDSLWYSILENDSCELWRILRSAKGERYVNVMRIRINKSCRYWLYIRSSILLEIMEHHLYV